LKAFTKGRVSTGKNLRGHVPEREFPTNSVVCSVTYTTGNLEDKRTELAYKLERCPGNFDEATNWEGKPAPSNVDTAEGPEARIGQKRFCIVGDDSFWECTSYVYH
jgi:hypothetical protein